MKRIQGSSVSLNEQTFRSLKPLVGTKGNAPFYDPNDLHCHIWKSGKLAVEDNPKVPEYSANKVSIRDCVYCKVCHIIKDSFQSTVSYNKDIVDDIIIVPRELNESEYKILKTPENKKKIEIKKITKQKTEFPKNINEKLYHKEDIYDEYIKTI